MNTIKIKEMIKKLVLTQKFAVLATADNNKPYTNLIAFTCSDNLSTIYFVTRRDTTKYENLCKNPQVSLLIDNRKNQRDDITAAQTVTVSGTAHTQQDNLLFTQQRLTKKHPYLAAFINSPHSVLIKLDVDAYILVTDFQETHTLKIT